MKSEVEIRENSAEPVPSVLIADLCEELSQLNDRSGSELLGIAEQLHEIAHEARDLTAASRNIAELAGGDAPQRAITILQEMIGELQAMKQVVEGSRSELEQIVPMLQESSQSISRMAQLPQLLHTIALLARIEAGRVSDNTVDVSLLSKEISGLSGQIDRYLEEISGKTSSVNESIAGMLRKADLSRSELYEKYHHLTVDTQSMLTSMRQRVDEASASARGIDGRYAGMRGAIDRVVMSLQVQDIARQRIEHVQEALAKLEFVSAPDAKQTTVVAMQRSQLLATRDLVDKSIGSIVQNIGSLSAMIQELTKASTAFASQTDEDGDSFSSTVNRGLLEIGPVFERFAEDARGMLAAFEMVLASVNEVTQGVRELEDIQKRVHITALNAMIETGRLGSGGAALRAVGSEVQGIAQSSRHDMESLLAILLNISSTIRNAAAERAQGSEATISRDIGDTRAEIKNLTKLFKSTNKQLSQGMTSVLEIVERLANQLSRTSELGARKAKIMDYFDSGMRQFDVVLQELGYQEHSLELLQEDSSSLNSMYSMESERAIHREYVVSASHALVATQQGPAVEEDGIELF